MFACYNNSLDVIKYLYDKGVNLKEKDLEYQVPYRS